MSQTGGATNSLSVLQAGAEQQARRDKESKASGPDAINTEITKLLCGCMSKEGKKSNFQLMDRCSNSCGKSRKRESKKKEGQSARKARKVAKRCVLPMFWASGGSKRRLPKAAGAEPCGGMRDQKLHAAVARSIQYRQVKISKSPQQVRFWKLSC